MRDLTPEECEALASRHNKAVEDEEIGHAAVEKFRREHDTNAWERFSADERRAFLNVADARTRGASELDEALRELSRVMGRPTP